MLFNDNITNPLIVNRKIFRINAALVLLLVSVILLVACGGNKKAPAQVEMAVVVPVFDADSAYSYVERQVAFGPRVPNSAAHRACGDYLESFLRACGADVVAQQVELTAYNGDLLQARNIIAQFQPQNKKRVMLCAHWDSRPWADSDPDESNHYKPILGANDGASGVGVLLEIARQLSLVQPAVGVDIVLFDAEDYGRHENDPYNGPGIDNSWALGSQYWARFPHKSNYNARYGILLDIVGAPSSRFLREGISEHFASNIVEKVWAQAAKWGYSDYFVNEQGGMVTDDHYYVNSFMGLPCIDIINYDASSPNGFGPHHHTVKDDMDWIDAATLKAVGQTVIAVIYNEK